MMFRFLAAATSSVIILLIFTAAGVSAQATSCTLADRSTPVGTEGLPKCLKVAFLSSNPNGGTENNLTEAQKYWANTLPQRVWSNIKRSLTVRGVELVEETLAEGVNWDHALNMVENGTYDTTVANFWILASRSTRVDFARAYMHEAFLLLHKTPPVKSASPIVNWADPHTAENWIVSIAIIVFGGFMLWLCELINHGFGGEAHQVILRPDEELQEDPFHVLRHVDAGACVEALKHALAHAFGCIFGTFDIVPRSFGGWMVSWALQWFVLFFMASYTANLASFLTLRQIAEPLSAKELLGKTVITVPTDEVITMIELQGPGKVTSFANSVDDYLTLFKSSPAESAALPELDVREITLRNCGFSATSTDMSIENAWIFRQNDAVFKAKAVIDEAMLQFADFGVLSNWVSSGLPADECGSGGELDNAGAMGLEELGGAFLVALILFAIAIIVGVITWVRERYHHTTVKEKYGENGPHRSDDIFLAEDAVDDCKDTVSDAKRAAAALVDLLSLRTHEGWTVDDAHLPVRTSKQQDNRQKGKGKKNKSSNNVEPESAEEKRKREGAIDVDAEMSPEDEENVYISKEAEMLFLFAGDGIDKPDESEDDEMEDDDEEEERELEARAAELDEFASRNNDKANANSGESSKNESFGAQSPSMSAFVNEQAERRRHGGGGGRSNSNSAFSPSASSQQRRRDSVLPDGSPGSPKPTNTAALSALHLAKIRGSVASVSSALHLAEDALNRAGRRRYCNIPIDTCNSRDGRPSVPDSTWDRDHQEEYMARMMRERQHMHALLEVSRSAARTASAVVSAAEVALLSSLMQQGRRRMILERWMRRAFRAAAFLSLLVAAATRRVANESVYVARMYLSMRRGHLSELSELSALIATEVDTIIKSVRVEEEGIIQLQRAAGTELDEATWGTLKKKKTTTASSSNNNGTGHHRESPSSHGGGARRISPQRGGGAVRGGNSNTPQRRRQQQHPQQQLESISPARHSPSRQQKQQQPRRGHTPPAATAAAAAAISPTNKNSPGTFPLHGNSYDNYPNHMRQFKQQHHHHHHHQEQDSEMALRRGSGIVQGGNGSGAAAPAAPGPRPAEDHVSQPALFGQDRSGGNSRNATPVEQHPADGGAGSGGSLVSGVRW